MCIHACRGGVIPVSYRKVKPNLTLGPSKDTTVKVMSTKDDTDSENEAFNNRGSNDYTTMTAGRGSIEMIEKGDEPNDGYETMVTNEGGIEDYYTVGGSKLLELDYPPLVGGISEGDNDKNGYVNVNRNVMGGAN